MPRGFSIVSEIRNHTDLFRSLGSYWGTQAENE